MKDKLINEFWVKHLATVTDVRNSGTKQQKTALFWYEKHQLYMPHDPNKLFLVRNNNRNKYWLIECMFCNRQYVVRSDYLQSKKCKC